MGLTMKDVFLEQYLAVAPIPLALVRAIDCRHISTENISGRILDAGCGDGLFARILLGGSANKIDVGIDSDVVELKKAERSGAYRELVSCDITHIPLASGAFDTVISNSVLEHIPGIDQALAELNRVLKPGGKLVFTVPSEYLTDQFFFVGVLRRMGLKDLALRYAGFKHKIWHHYHVDPLSVWQDRFRRHDFEIVRFKYIHPQAVTEICDIFTFSGALSFFWRKWFGRLLLFPSAIRGKVMAGLLRTHYQTEADIGSTLFFVVRKTV